MGEQVPVSGLTIWTMMFLH